MASSKSDPPIPNVPDSVADVSASSSPTKFRWLQVVELGYMEEPTSSSTNGDAAEGTGETNASVSVENEEPICFHCGKVANEAESNKLSRCARCEVAAYW